MLCLQSVPLNDIPIFYQESEQINQFQLKGVIACGSTGYIRECINARDHRTYALKCVSKKALMHRQGFRFNVAASRGAQLSPSQNGVTIYLNDFKQEVMTLRGLRHPHIIRLYGLIGDDQHDLFYMVYEYAPLGPVMVLGPETVPFPEDRARLFFHQLVQAVDFLHRRDIIHRDIKPANILLKNKCCIKLADFGLTYMLSKSEARLRRSVGTPAFQSPEAIAGDAGCAVDVWAMGVTLYCFVFGRTPWPDVQNVLQLYKHIREDSITFDPA